MAGSIREVGAYGGPVGGEPGGSSGGPPLDPTVAARLQRSEAAARLDAFAASDPCGDGATNQLDHGRQCDTEINDAALFEKQPGDVDAVDSRDLQQGRLADCYLLAPLAAMAGTPEGCAFLRHAIVENKSADGHVVSYTVTLHELQHGRFGMARARDVPVTVDPRFVVGHAGLRLEGNHHEIWPLVVEKACAKYLGGYNQLDRARSPSDALALLTGRQPQYVSFDWPKRWVSPYSETTLKADLASGKLVILNSRSDIAGPTRAPEREAAHGLAPSHAYFVKAVEERDGKCFVRLGNVWPGAKPVVIPFDELTRWFSGVHLGSLR